MVCAEADEARLGAYADRFRLARVADGVDEFHLAYDGTKLELIRRGDAKGLWVDRTEIERRLTGPFLLGRACGMRQGWGMRLLDATAGLGVDGLSLALSGQQVHLVERNPLLWALLHDLLDRLGAVASGARLTHGDSRELLGDGGDRYDVIYFDPMFPARAKTALPGKRMQYLAALLGEGMPLDEGTIEQARERASSRVVLKRRARDPQLGRPDWTIRGRSVRYDVYRGRGTTADGQPSSRMA